MNPLPWSLEWLALRSPKSTFETLRIEPISWRLYLAQVARSLVVLAAFVSFTSAGRLTILDILWTIVFWSFAPVLQALAALLAGKILAKQTPSLLVVTAMIIGNGPWLILLSIISAMCIVIPSPGPAFLWMLRVGLLPALLLATAFTGVFLTYKAFRYIADLSAAKTVAATGVYYMAYVGLILSWYLSLYELQPLVMPP